MVSTMRRVLLSLLLLAPLVTAADGPIRVGTTQSLSGRFAEEGRAQLEGLRLWVEDLNARGQLLGRPVELVYHDDGSDPAKAAALYRQLIGEQRVDLLIGPYSSALTLSATEVAESADFPILTTAASAERIWRRGFRNVFGIDVPASSYMDIAVAEAAARGARRAALFYAEGRFGQSVAEGVRREADRLGLELVLDRSYAPEQADFASLATALLAREDDIDVAFGATYLADAVALVGAFGPEGLAVDMLALTVGPALTDFGSRLGGGAEGIVGVTQWLPTVRLPKAQDFSYRYRQRYGHAPGVHAAIGYSAGQVVEAAVRLAGSTDRDALREQLRTLRFRSLMGHYQVDDSGRQVGKRNYLLQWQDGRRRLVAPAAIAEQPLRYPMH